MSVRLRTAPPAGRRPWRELLLALIAFQVVFPLLVLAASPGRLASGFPVYRYNPLEGDAYGYYYCVREILASWRRGAPLLAVVAVVGALAIVRSRRYGPAALAFAICVVVAAFAAALAYLVHFSGAAQVGWPLLWSVPLLPLKTAGVSVSPDVAFAFGLALSIACNAITVAAMYFLGRALGLGRTTSLLGTAVYALWPLVSLLAGSGAWENGTWQIEQGLSLYTEPFSTALVTVALLLVVRGLRSEAVAIVAGTLLGVATVVRLSNLIILVVVLAFLVWQRRRRVAVALAAGAAPWAATVLLFWPKSYPRLKPPVFPEHPFSLSYARDAWEHSLLWHPAVLLAIVPLALLGIRKAESSRAVLLWACVAATAAFYSVYQLTPLHPRFLFVILPIVLLFWAAGVEVVVGSISRLYHRRG